MRHSRKALLVVQACSFTALLSSNPALAADGTGVAATPTEADGKPAEIVVTAQKRSENLQKVPIAMTALGRDTLTQKNVTQVTDLGKYVPGLTVTAYNGSGFPEFTLRGIGAGSFNKNTVSTVAVYLDGFVLDTPISQTGELYDLDRVEVLNGPQGTLYGKNSTGGAINFITRRPDGTTEADGTFSVGRYGEYDVEGGFQTAITGDLSIRVAGNRNYSDGYAYNFEEHHKEDGVDDYGGRVGIRYKSGNVDSYFKFYVDGLNNATQAFTLLGVNTNGSPRADNSNPLNGFIPVPGIDEFGGTGNFIHNRNIGATFNNDIEINDYLTLTSITGYVDARSRVSLDTDGQPAAQGNVPHSNVTSHQFSQELRLSSPGENIFSWIAGADYFHKSLTTYNLYDLTAVGYPLINQTLDEKDISYAGFVDATLRLGGGFSLIGGVRLTHDETSGHYISTESAIGPYNKTLKRDFTEPTWRAVLNYQLDPKTLLYASYSRGYRAGALNNGFVSNAGGLGIVKPEFVDNFEGGVKTTVFDGHLRLDAALFYMKYRDQQLNAAPPGSSFFSTVNAGRSRIYGLEINGSLVLGRFSVNVSSEVINAKFQDFPYSSTINYAGIKLGFVPNYKVVLSPEYHLPTESGYFFISPDATFTGKVRNSTIPDPYGRDIQKATATLDGQLGYRWSAGYSVFAWMKNVSNNRVLEGYTGGYGYNELFYSPPRTFGLTVTARYK